MRYEKPFVLLCWLLCTVDSERRELCYECSRLLSSSVNLTDFGSLFFGMFSLSPYIYWVMLITLSFNSWDFLKRLLLLAKGGNDCYFLLLKDVSLTFFKNTWASAVNCFSLGKFWLSFFFFILDMSFCCCLSEIGFVCLFFMASRAFMMLGVFCTGRNS